MILALRTETQAPLPTRSTDATRFDNRTAGRSFFPVSAVSPSTLDTSALSCPRHGRATPRPRSDATLYGSRSRRLRLSTLGGDTAAPPFSTSASAYRRLPCGSSSDTPFSAAVSRGHGRLATSPAPWRHGAPLLSRHAGPSGFPVPPKKIGHHLPGRTANLLGSPRKSGAWPGEQAPPAL